MTVVSPRLQTVSHYLLCLIFFCPGNTETVYVINPEKHWNRFLLNILLLKRDWQICDFVIHFSLGEILKYSTRNWLFFCLFTWKLCIFTVYTNYLLTILLTLHICIFCIISFIYGINLVCFNLISGITVIIKTYIIIL